MLVRLWRPNQNSLGLVFTDAMKLLGKYYYFSFFLGDEFEHSFYSNVQKREFLSLLTVSVFISYPVEITANQG